MSRAAKICLSLLMTIVLPIVVGILLIRFFDWNYAKPLLNDFVSHSLERPFSIKGDLSISWARERTDDSWKRLVPWPHLVAHDVVIGNPKWGSTQGDFIAIGKIMFSADPISLLSNTVSIPALVLESSEIRLLRNADGKNNWTFFDEKRNSIWKLDLSRIVISNGIAHLDDEGRNIHLNGNFETMLDGGVEGYGVVWEFAGKYKGENLTASGKSGALLDLRSQTAPYPISARIQHGKTRAEFKGTFTKPSDLASLDLQMNLAGPSMADLYYLSGIAMPQTPAYNTEGRLTGMLSKQGAVFHYENFKGRVGSSDLTGNLEYQSKQMSGRQRPLLTGRVQSNLLLFKDLGPIIGTGPNSSIDENSLHQAHSPDKVLPTQEFSFERWRNIDVDVAFAGAKIIRDEHLPFENLSTHIVLQDGVLSLLPLEFGVAGGKFVSNIKMDGNGTAIKAELTASARQLKLNQLAPGFKPMQSSLGELNGDIKLSATGNSVAVLLGMSNGEIKVLINQGTVSKLMLDEAGLNVANVLLTKIFGDKQVKLNCVAGDFIVTDGIMNTRNFLVDTDESDIGMTGRFVKREIGLDHQAAK